MINLIVVVVELRADEPMSVLTRHTLTADEIAAHLTSFRI